jgi:hypothetical protein
LGAIGNRGRTAASPSRRQTRQRRLLTCCFVSWRGDSNPQPAVYKTAGNRPPGTGECGPCSSRRVGRPASTLLTSRVLAGGIDKRNDMRPHHPRPVDSMSGARPRRRLGAAALHGTTRPTASSFIGRKARHQRLDQQAWRGSEQCCSGPLSGVSRIRADLGRAYRRWGCQPCRPWRAGSHRRSVALPGRSGSGAAPQVRTQ